MRSHFHGTWCNKTISDHPEVYFSTATHIREGLINPDFVIPAYAGIEVSTRFFWVPARVTPDLIRGGMTELISASLVCAPKVLPCDAATIQ